MDRGVVVETVETATSWSNLERLYRAVRAALPGFHVGCHISHLYPTGASLYFTVLGRQSADPVAQWQAAKDAVSRAIVAPAGRSPTTTRSAATTRPTCGDEIGELGLELLARVKTRCDPAGIMNPGKLGLAAG